MNLLHKIVSIEKDVANTGISYLTVKFLGIKIKFSKLSKKKFIVNHILSPLYNRDIWEKQYVTKFISELKDINYQDDYINLISNLDDSSINVVNSILARIQLLQKSKEESFDLFTTEEKEKIKQLPSKFLNNILKINDNCYAYNKYLLPIEHFEICVFRDKHEIERLNKDYFKDKNIIDAGGYIGESAIVFSDYTSKKVFSFEPIKENYEIMQQTLKLNKRNNIVSINKGLSDKNEEYEMNFAGSSSGKYTPINTKRKELVNLITLDSFVKENNIEIGLIKTDLEGFEQQFFKGAEKTIKEQKPTLIISIYHCASDFFKIKPLIESWNLGYKFRIVKPIDKQILLETILIAEIEPKNK